jgi:Icc-related predicted phosphoesterase
VRLVCVSDTHNRAEGIDIPEGDVLLHAGDLTGHGEAAEVARAARWLASLPHAHKVVVAGNHDFLFQKQPEQARALLTQVPGLVYLEDSEATVAGLRIHGTPWQPWFHDWAFNLPRQGSELARVWSRVPAGIDVLLAHSPAHGILDLTSDGRAVGCELLRAELLRIRPRLHVFGHIHEAHGDVTVDGTRHVNASICDLRYRPVQAPVVVDL